MGLFSSPIKTLDDLFNHMLQDIYYAEQQITKNLPSMAKKASNAQLKAAFEQHLDETEGHVKRLEDVFAMLGKSKKGVTCAAMDGILDETKEIMADCGDAEVLDAAMLCAAQAIEHYEITRYGTMVAFAEQLGRGDVAELLEQSLQEEKKADSRLTQIAESRVNRKAA